MLIVATQQNSYNNNLLVPVDVYKFYKISYSLLVLHYMALVFCLVYVLKFNSSL